MAAQQTVTEMVNNKKRKISIHRILIIIFISLVLGLGIYHLNAKTITGEQMPMPFGIGVGVVMSGSMEPELSVDDVIIVKKCDNYNVGDTVVYQDGRTLIVHKIIEANGDTVITQGTANNTPDEPITLSSVKGKVIRSFSGLGMFVTAIKSPAATLVMLVAAVYLLFRSYRREQENDENDLDLIREEIEKLKEKLK